MNSGRAKSYRFANEAQWNACFFVRADRSRRMTGNSIRPFPPFGRPGTLYESSGAHAPVVTGSGEIIWLDDQNTMYRLPACSPVPETFPAPFARPRTRDSKEDMKTFRVVATAGGLWVSGDPPQAIRLYEEDTMTQLVSVDLPDMQLLDIAGDAPGCLMALVRRDETHAVIRVGSSGHFHEHVELQDIRDAKAFAYLRTSKRFVVLAGADPRLYWFSEEGGRPFFSFPVAAMRPCFHAKALGSNSLDMVFLAGVEDLGGQGYVVFIDSEGNSLGDVPLDLADTPPTGVVATRKSLFVTGRRGLVRFDVAEIVPEGSEQVSTMVMTPVLFSPDREDRRRWLRVETTATLPKGSRIDIAWAATNDPPPKTPALLKDETLRATDLVSDVLSKPGIRRGSIAFHGTDDSEKVASRTFAAPLFGVSERYLRVLITLTAPIGSRLPELTELKVHYPGRTLMENLPSIYQRDEARPDSFLRSLVGVLETTTQGLDATIGSMGSNIHPATAPEDWLDFIARWLGLPWDDELSPEQKRELARQGPHLSKARGTRSGLETLLESLIPGTPRRFRVTDATADFGFAVVGGQACTGSALPALLGGNTRWHPELDSGAVVGYMRLPCPGQLEDGAWQLAGKVLVEVAATAAERKVWEPWLFSLIKEMVPVTARVELRWTTKHALRTGLLDDTLEIESAPAPHLGTDAITNLARLPESGTRLTTTGASIGKSLG